MNIGKWDNWNEDGEPKYPHEKVIQFCFRRYKPGQRVGVRALDLGCGGGVHTVFLAREGFQVTGTDVSEVAIRKTAEALEDTGTSATLRRESADVLDFPDDRFDLVVCVGVYDCTGPDVARASIERLRHVLRTGAGGLFMFASDRDYRVQGDNPLGLHGYCQDEVEAMFSGSFAKVWIDRTMTTYEDGRLEQNDWLITLEK